MNFYFGDSYYSSAEDSLWQSVLLNFLGALFGFWFALYLYYKAVRSDKKKEIENEDNEFKDKLTYLHLLIDGSVSHINGLFALIKMYATEQRKDLLELQVLRFKVNHDIKRINNLDSLGIFLAYRKQFAEKSDWVDDYRKINKATDSVLEIEVEVKRMFTFNSTENSKKLEEIRDIINHVPNRLSAFSMKISNKLGPKKKEDTRYIFLTEQINLYGKYIAEAKPISFMGDEYLKNLMELILKDHQHEDFAEEILLMGKQARVKIHEVRTDVERYLTEMENVEPMATKALEVLKNESVKLKEASKKKVQ